MNNAHYESAKKAVLHYLTYTNVELTVLEIKSGLKDRYGEGLIRDVLNELVAEKQVWCNKKHHSYTYIAR